MNDKEKLVALLRILAEISSRCTDEEIVALRNIDVSQALKLLDDKRPLVKRKSVDSSEFDGIGAIASLQKLESRQEGKSYLRDVAPNRKALELAARLLDIPVLREDNSERLIEKIVEVTIGTRLNSNAIRGRD